MADKLRVIGQKVKALSTFKLKPAPKTVDPHYESPEHKAWRAKVIARAGGRCKGLECAKPDHPGRLFADHVIELKDGGAPFDVANGMALCGSCHTRKTLRARQRRFTGSSVV